MCNEIEKHKYMKDSYFDSKPIKIAASVGDPNLIMLEGQ